MNGKLTMMIIWKFFLLINPIANNLEIVFFLQKGLVSEETVVGFSEGLISFSKPSDLSKR